MALSMLGPDLRIVAPKGVQSLGWQVGQIKPAQISPGALGQTIVNIDGKAFNVSSSVQLPLGDVVMLRVAELYPAIVLALVKRTQGNVRNSDASTVVLSEKFSQGILSSETNARGQLSSLIAMLHFNSSLPLPPATTVLIDALRRRLTRPDKLIQPQQLKAALSNDSLQISTSNTSSRAANSGLAAILMGIAASLESKSLTRQYPLGTLGYRQSMGLDLYGESDKEQLKAFSRRVHEQVSNLIALKQLAHEDMQQKICRLLIELPVLDRDQIKSLRVRFFERRSKSKQEPDSSQSSVEFEFELIDCGLIHARIELYDTAAVLSIACENVEFAESIRSAEASLSGRLMAYGLYLQEYEVTIGSAIPNSKAENPTQRGESSSLSESPIEDSYDDMTTSDEYTRKLLQDAFSQGAIPDLNEFTLEQDRQVVNTGTEIPENLYCAMAVLFATLFQLNRT